MVLAEIQQAPPSLEPSTRTSSRFQFLAIGGIDGLTLNFKGTLPRQLRGKGRQDYRLLIKDYVAARPHTYFNGLKVGIRQEIYLNPSQIPSTFSYYAYPELHATYAALSGNAEIPKEIQERAAHAGIQIVWLTTEKDGSRKLVLEERSAASAVYPEALGTIGGGIDGKVQKRNAAHGWATLDPQSATPEAILEQGWTEAAEELGIPDEKIAQMKQQPNAIRFLGVAHDTIKGQTDFLAIALYPESAESLQKEFNAHHNKGHHTLHDPKKLVFIDGTDDAIEKVLTRANLPLPPMPQAALLLAGRYLHMERADRLTSSGIDVVREGERWRENVQQHMEEHYVQLDEQIYAQQQRDRQLDITRAETHIEVEGKKLGFLPIGDNERHLYEGKMVSNKEREKRLTSFKIAVDKAQKLIDEEIRKGYNPDLPPYAQGFPDAKRALRDIGILYNVPRRRFLRRKSA